MIEAETGSVAPGARGVAIAVLGSVAPALPFLDRAVLAAAVEAFRAELWLTDATLGLVASVHVLLLALAGPAFLALGDRGPRPRLVASGLGIAAVGTALAGAAGNFPALLAALGTAGIGLAGAASLAPDVLARRGRSAAMLAGGTAAGYALGAGAVALAQWRASFPAAGSVCLVCAVAWLATRDPAPGPFVGLRGGRNGGGFVPFAADRIALAARQLSGRRSWLIGLAALALLAFAASALAFWAPAFLVRVRGLPRHVATGQLAAAALMAGLSGTLLGPRLATWLRTRTAEADRLAAGVWALAAAPVLLVACVDPRPAVYLTAIVAGLAFLFAAARPGVAALLADAGPVERTSAIAVAFLAVRVLGDAPGPLLVGLLADAASLGRAVLAVPAAALAAGALWTVAAQRRAAQRVRGER